MKKLVSAFMPTLAFAKAGPLAVPNFDRGQAAYRAGDYTTALKEWKPLAEQGNANAQYNLAVMCKYGIGIPQDYVEAVKWFSRSAEQEYADAQYDLALMYQNGVGVPQNNKEAVKWYRLAGEQGNADAQKNLGFMYDYGKGVLQDYVRAHMWYNIAAANGHDKAGKWRDNRASKMTPEDISKAQAMAKECMGSNYRNCGF